MQRYRHAIIGAGCFALTPSHITMTVTVMTDEVESRSPSDVGAS
jgi:hypothetical protein